MQISIVASSSARHQFEHAQALKAGLARHNIVAKIHQSASHATEEIVACWGWRAGALLKTLGKRVLVMERGYVGDRFKWSSLGWDGLNGNAVMPEIDDGGSRFRAHFSHLLRETSHEGEYVLLIGQVPRDAALAGRDLTSWYLDTSAACERVYGLPTAFRAHPRAPAGSYPKSLMTVTGDLADNLQDAAVVVTYNSNTAVDSVLAGKATIAIDRGSMAWDVTAHTLGEYYEGDRLRWAYQMAWKQWSMDEISDGSALERVLEVM
jgi:hypothetical protein